MKSTPFKRAMMMLAAIQAAILPGGPGLASIGEYVSRGKGLGRHSGKKWGPTSSGRYVGVTNGKRECERRMRQIERGIIAVSA